MQTPEQPPARRLRSRPENLAKLYVALARQLAETGLASSQLSEVFSSHVSARCTVCGFSFTGEQLGTWAVLDPDTKPDDPGLARLRLGYCGRVGCESWYYVLEVNEYPGVNWANILKKVDSSECTEGTESEQSALRFSSLLPHLQVRTWVCLGCGLAVLLTCFAVRYRIQGGRIPVLEPKHHYMLER
jgi:hypothetical protein